jgi:hypothetical protein
MTCLASAKPLALAAAIVYEVFRSNIDRPVFGRRMIFPLRRNEHGGDRHVNSHGILFESRYETSYDVSLSPST